MTDWNFADVWEAVADTVPHAPSAIHGERRLTWADTERRANGVARFLLELGRRPPGQGGALPLQRPRVHGVDLRHPEGRPRARSTPITATPTTSSCTCGTTPMPWRSSSTARSASASPGSGPRVPRVRAWLWVDDGTEPVPAVGDALRGRGRERGRAGRGALGAQRRRPLPPLHRRDHGDAQRGHVAPGRPVRQAQCREPPARARGRGHRRGAQDHRGLRPPAPAGVPPHARHRRVHRRWRP